MSARFADLLRSGAATLARAGIVDAPRDARHLLAFAAGVGRDRLTLLGEETVGDAAALRYAAAIEDRAARKPVSRIIGMRDFFGRAFEINGDVLDPRPESETLVAQALDGRPKRILDLGTGSGCLLVSLLAERGDATGVGTDISGAALRVARANAERNGVAARAEWVMSDWFGAVAGRFDLIVSNPPYIPAEEVPTLAAEVRDHDPRPALTPGPDGIAAYRAIVASARGHMVPDGRLIVEIGPRQSDAVAALFEAAGLRSVSVHRDLDGRARVVSGETPA